MSNLLQTAFNAALQTTVRRVVPASGNAEAKPGSASASSCALKHDWMLGRTVVFQIDSHSLQYCIIERRLSSVEIVDFGKIYRPRTGAQLSDHSVFLSDEIMHLSKQHNLNNVRFGLSISSTDIAVRTIRIPKMPLNEERRAVYFEGDKSVPFSLDDAYWSYRRCEQITSGESVDVSITLMALPKTALNETLEFFAANKISFDFISLDIEALGLALERIPDFSENQPHGLLNIRPTRTDISLYSGTRLKFLHHGGFGSVALGQSLQFDSAAQEFMPQALENFAEGLANIIQNALDYYGAQHGLGEIETFYIYGDFSYSEQLIDMLSERFGMAFKRFPTEVFDSFIFADPSLKDVVPVALPVVSAATSPYALSDFTPESVHAIKSNQTFLRRAIATAALVIITLGAVWSSELWREKIAKRELLNSSETVNSFESSPAYAGYRVLKAELLRQQTIINELEQGDSEHYLALKEIAALTPAAIRLDFLNYFPSERGATSTLNGSVISRLVAPEVILAEFTSRLGGSPLFSDVQLKNHSKRIEGAKRTITFSITLTPIL